MVVKEETGGAGLGMAREVVVKTRVLVTRFKESMFEGRKW